MKWCPLPPALRSVAFAVVALAAAGAAGTAGAEQFTLGDIEVRGRQNLPEDSILSYIPFVRGDLFDTEEDPPRVVRELFDTGFFSTVKLSRDGNRLIVAVRERPAISSFEVFGSQLLKPEIITKIAGDFGIYRGGILDPFIAERLEKEIRAAHRAAGLYGASAKMETTPLDNNRVKVELRVVEGIRARIRSLDFVGNSSFEREDLRRAVGLKIGEKYRALELQTAQEALLSHYLDQGFINARIFETELSISRDRKNLYIAFHIEEGQKFRYGDIELAGEALRPQAELREELEALRGEPFSRRRLTEFVEGEKRRMSREGYAFARVDPLVELREGEGEVAVTLVFDPGFSTLVRRLSFAGNETGDPVFRRHLLLHEGAPFDSSLLELSLRRLRRLPYIANVEYELVPVPGTPNQVDVVFRIEESRSGSISLQFGYAEPGGFNIAGNISQRNFLGTGKDVGIQLSSNELVEELNFRINDPFYSEKGISRFINVFFRETSASAIDAAADYVLDEAGATLRYGLPLAEDVFANLGAGFSILDIQGGGNPSQEIRDFIESHARSLSSFNLTASLVRDTRDNILFPNLGTENIWSSEVALAPGDFRYYKLGYGLTHYFPLGNLKSLAFQLQLNHADGLGGEDLPFFENYLAGGLSTVRGFSYGSLGPRDSQGNAFGGKARVISRLEYIFMPPWSGSESQRLSLFIDNGGVFAKASDVDFSELRASYGISFTWITPIAPLLFSYALPFERREGDLVDRFVFTLGTAF